MYTNLNELFRGLGPQPFPNDNRLDELYEERSEKLREMELLHKAYCLFDEYAGQARKAQAPIIFKQCERIMDRYTVAMNQVEKELDQIDKQIKCRE